MALNNWQNVSTGMLAFFATYRYTIDLVILISKEVWRDEFLKMVLETRVCEFVEKL